MYNIAILHYVKGMHLNMRDASLGVVNFCMCTSQILHSNHKCAFFIRHDNLGFILKHGLGRRLKRMYAVSAIVS